MKKNNFLVVAALLFSFCCYGQLLPPTNYQVKVSYDVEKKVYYTASNEADITDFSSIDLVKMEPRKEQDHIEKYLEPDGNTSVFITHLSTENIYPSWMLEPTSTVINQNGIYKYDANGQLMKTVEHDALYRVLYKIQRLHFSPERFGRNTPLQNLSEAEVFQLESDGNTVVVGADGFTTITKLLGINEFTTPNTIMELRYQPGGNSMEKITRVNGEITRREVESYQLNEDEDYVIARREIHTNKTTSSGVCFKRISVEVFKNYKIEQSIKSLKVDLPSAGLIDVKLRVTPNPFKNNMVAHLPTSFPINGTLTVNNLFGQEIERRLIDNSKDVQVQVNTADWPSGTYIILLSLVVLQM